MKRLATLASLCSLFAVPALAQEDLAAVDKPAPIFRLPVYNAEKVGTSVVALDKYVGPDATEKDVKVVLLSFMASFCGPCKKEMPYLQALHEKGKDLGLKVVMVSIDTEPAGQKIVEDLIAQNKVTFPVLKDRFQLVARRWLGSQSPLPSVFMVKPDGIVSMVHRGYNQEASELLASEVEKALGVKLGPVLVAQPAEAPKATEAPATPEIQPASATDSDSATENAGGVTKAKAKGKGKKGGKRHKKGAAPTP